MSRICARIRNKPQTMWPLCGCDKLSLQEKLDQRQRVFHEISQTCHVDLEYFAQGLGSVTIVNGRL